MSDFGFLKFFRLDCCALCLAAVSAHAAGEPAAISLSDTPVAVQKTIKSGLESGKLTSIQKTEDDDGSAYLVDSIQSAQTRDMEIEIPLEDSTPDVQKTIKEKVGSGRIVAVYKSFVKREKVLPFQVESVKVGKPFDFSVGPKGRFLGLDE